MNNASRVRFVAILQIAMGAVLGWGNGMALLSVLIADTEHKIQLGALIVISIAFLFGVYSLISGCKKNSLVTKYNRYSSRLNIFPKMSIDDLAKSFNSSPKRVKKEFSKMVKLGLFPSSILSANPSERAAAVNSAFAKSYAVKAPTSSSAANNSPQPVSAKCPNCGAAVTAVLGTAAKCEYCDFKFIAAKENKL